MEQKMYITNAASRRRGLNVLIVTMFLFFARSAFSDDIDDAREVSRSILEKLENKQFSEVWSNDVSTWLKNKGDRASFLGNMTVIQAQLGGASSSRVPIQQNKSQAQASPEYTGDIYSFMYETQFPNAKVYETIVVLVEGGRYKLSGINYVPNPN